MLIGRPKFGAHSRDKRRPARRDTQSRLIIEGEPRRRSAHWGVSQGAEEVPSAPGLGSRLTQVSFAGEARGEHSAGRPKEEAPTGGRG